MDFKWINTAGGPFVVLRAEDVRKWSGCFSIQSIEKGEIIFEDDFLEPSKTHYGQACQIWDDIGLIDFELNQAIVLSLPYLTTLKKISENILLIFRWEYGKSSEDVDDLLQFITDTYIDNWENTGLNIELNKDYIIFDSANIGFDLQEEEKLIFEMDFGIYSIEMADYKPNKQTYLKAFKFEKH